MGMQVESSAMGFASLNPRDETEWDIYGDDMYTTIPGLGLGLGLEPVGPSLEPVQPSNPTATVVVPLDKAEEDRRIKALVETPALEWPWSSEMHVAGYGTSGRGFGRCRGGRLATGHSYGRGRGGLGSKIPPPGYVCYRCNEPGHFIQHCPTNGDSNYDIKMVKLPTGVPKSMLMANPEGSYVLPSGEIAVLEPDEAAFEKEMEGLPTTRPVRDLPPELHCPMCKKVMRDAMLTSKCCFSSFCDKCISDYIISKSMCVCGALNILADDLLPNLTLRETINNMESSSSSSETYGSLGKIQFPTLSSTSNGEEKQPPVRGSPCKKEGGSTSEQKMVSALTISLKNVATASSRAELSDKTPESGHHVQIKAHSPTSKGEDKQSITYSPYMKESESTSIEKSVKTMMQSLENETTATSTRVNELKKAPELISSKEMTSQEVVDGLSGAMPYLGYTPGLYGAIPLEGIHPQYSLGPQGYNLSAAPQSYREYSKDKEFRNDRKRKAITFSSRDEGGNKRKLSEMSNRSRENHSSHRHRASNYQDYHRLTKSTESREEYHFNRRSSCSREDREGGHSHLGHRYLRV